MKIFSLQMLIIPFNDVSQMYSSTFMGVSKDTPNFFFKSGSIIIQFSRKEEENQQRKKWLFLFPRFVPYYYYHVKLLFKKHLKAREEPDNFFLLFFTFQIRHQERGGGRGWLVISDPAEGTNNKVSQEPVELIYRRARLKRRKRNNMAHEFG